MQRRYCFTAWEGWHNLKLNSTSSICIQSLKWYMHTVLYLLLKNFCSKVTTIFDLQKLEREEKHRSDTRFWLVHPLQKWLIIFVWGRSDATHRALNVSVLLLLTWPCYNTKNLQYIHSSKFTPPPKKKKGGQKRYITETYFDRTAKLKSPP